MSTMKIMNILILYVVLFVLSTVVAVQAADGNLVLNKPVTTSFAAASYPGNLAVDNSAATYWRVGVTEGEIWLVVDLGRPMPFDSYKLDVYGYPYMSGYKFQYSNDGEHWTDAMEKIDAVLRDEAGSFPTVTARYVRYVALRNDTKSSAIGLRNFELYYHGNPVLGQLAVPEIGYVVPSPLQDVYDVIVPDEITQVTLQAVPMTATQSVLMNGERVNQVVVELGAGAEQVVMVTVTEADGKSNTFKVILKRRPTQSDYYQLTYEDHFTGDGLNTNDWFYRTGTKWDSYNLPSNVRVGPDAAGNSNLYIDFKQADYNMDGKLDYSAGGIISRNPFGYGYYEVRAKLYGATPGLHQSFWTMGSFSGEDVQSGQAPRLGALLEIDGFEVDSENSSRLNVTIHRHFPEAYSYPGRARFEIDTTNWFTWGFEWLPGRVNFYADGEYVYTYHIEDVFAPQNVLLTALADGRTYTQAPLSNAAAQFDYFRFYARVDQEINYVGNASFELNNSSEALGWIKQGAASASKVVAGGRSGEYALEHSGDQAYQATTKQRLSHLPQGTYQVSAWVRSSGGHTAAKLQVSNYGGEILEVNLEPSSEWRYVVIDQVAVTENYMEIAVVSASDGAASVWLQVDDVAVMRK
ncbi:MAG TPA: family 16 glycosylhydrolase [Firmicutes bacterium]|nr:family 16 glycosylhydrolase [Bacillota bacterium]